MTAQEILNALEHTNIEQVPWGGYSCFCLGHIADTFKNKEDAALWALKITKETIDGFIKGDFK